MHPWVDMSKPSSTVLAFASTTLAAPTAATRRYIARVSMALLLMMGHLSLGLGTLADGHLLGEHDHDPPAAQTTGGGDEGCGDPCDHCCHASAHLLAIPPAPGARIALAQAAPVSQDGRSWASRPTAPPRRPPRSSS
jgi:hypothetical protein